MPVATALPSSSIVLRYPASVPPVSSSDLLEESYQLLELPGEILKAVEGSNEPFSLTIKGRPNDDAVLCTPTTTFLLRAVTVSNSLLILRPPPARAQAPPRRESDATTTTLLEKQDAHRPHTTLEIRDVCHEVLECVPQAANLERIRAVLRDSAWQGAGSALGKRKRHGDGSDDGGESGKTPRRYTREMLASVIQASEAELERGLKERNVIPYQGRMLLLPLKHLHPLLSLMLTLLTLHHTELTLPTPSSSASSTSTGASATCPAQPVVSALAEDHDVDPEVAGGVMRLFGEVGGAGVVDSGEVVVEGADEGEGAGEGEGGSGGKSREGGVWTCRPAEMVREVGRGLLEATKADGVAVAAFLGDWKEAVGETWAELVDLRLLESEHLVLPRSPTAPARIVPFPLHQLPLAPAARFADLFLTRPKWRPGEMLPFLKGLCRDGDIKERDKLVAKFVRVVKDKEGKVGANGANGGGGAGGGDVWWYPRRSV